MGYYPCPPEAVEHVMPFVNKPNHRIAMLDPCAGEGKAIIQIADILGVRRDQVFAVELEQGRSAKLQEALGDAGGTVVAPASFMGVDVQAGSFSFAWVNPPFDDELQGGQRVEYAFLQRATRLMAKHGLLAFVIPENQATSPTIRDYLLTWYENITVVPFPEEHRKYREVVVFATKRAKGVGAKERPDWQASVQVYENSIVPGHQYQIPPANGPKWFTKVELTEAEIISGLAESPLRKMLQPPPEPPLGEPPLPLYKGHIALLLASGNLDGLVCPKGEAPHVVRGTALKRESLASQNEEELADGSTKTTKIYTESIKLMIRVADETGEIHTLE
jgi:Uncharacterised methyltransferase family (DUF6094)